MNKLLALSLLFALLQSGCSDNSAKEIQDTYTKQGTAPKALTTVKKAEKKPDKQLTKPQSKAELSKFYDTFKDSAKISTDGKEMLLIFGQDSDPYTQKIKNDIINDDELSTQIKKTVTPIYIDARGQKQHKFQHNGEMMDVDTKTLVGIYNVNATPTLIFTDSEAGHIFVVPGYMPPDQFKVTLDFVQQKKWKDKDRKNGEVYEALKEFYKANGIDVKESKKATK